MQPKQNNNEIKIGLLIVILTPILIYLITTAINVFETKSKQPYEEEKSLYVISTEEETDPDIYINKIINRWSQDSTSKDEILKKSFVSLMYSLQYKPLHKDEETDPKSYDIQVLSEELMKEKGGNCANITAMFYKAAKKLGYNPQFCYGKVRQRELVDDHCWVEIQNDDGEWKIYDLTFDMTPAPQTYDTLEYFGVDDSAYKAKDGELFKLGNLEDN